MKTPAHRSAAELRPLGLVISGRVRATPPHKSCVTEINSFTRTSRGTERQGQAGMGALSLGTACYFEGTVD